MLALNHYPRHVGDYLRDTVGLTMLEDGAYTRLLDQYYSRGGPLPIDKATIYRIARAVSKQERAAVDSVLTQFFAMNGNGWHNKRSDLELQAQSERSASARESAKLKWDKYHANASANAMPTDMQTHSDGNAESMLASNQKPVTIKPKSSKTKTSGEAAPLPPWISAELWQQWRENRKALKAPMTPHGEALLVNKLARMLAKGHDPTAIVEQSIEHGWKGFWEVKSEASNVRQNERNAIIEGLTGGYRIEGNDKKTG